MVAIKPPPDQTRQAPNQEIVVWWIETWTRIDAIKNDSHHHHNKSQKSNLWFVLKEKIHQWVRTTNNNTIGQWLGWLVSGGINYIRLAKRDMESFPNAILVGLINLETHSSADSISFPAIADIKYKASWLGLAWFRFKKRENPHRRKLMMFACTET